MVKIQSSDSKCNIYKHGTQKDVLTNLSNVDIIFDDDHVDNDADRAVGVKNEAKPYNSNDAVRKERVPNPAFAEGNDTLIYPHNTNDSKVIDYYCPNCHSTYNEKVRVVFSSVSDKIHSNTTTWMECENCDGVAVEIDHEMVDIISKLNQMGLETEYCCEGHGFEDPAYISFSVKANDILNGIDAPYLWSYDPDSKIADNHAIYGVDDTYTIIDSYYDLISKETWERCDGTISLLYKGMKVAVYNIEDSLYDGIYICTNPEENQWEKIQYSENMKITITYTYNKVIRPTLIENPNELQKIYGCHFDIYKNIYMNSLRAWVDNVKTILIERNKKVEG